MNRPIAYYVPITSRLYVRVTAAGPTGGAVVGKGGARKDAKAMGAKAAFAPTFLAAEVLS